MPHKIKKLSVWILTIFLLITVQIDSFFISECWAKENITQQSIIPLVYIENIEYHNHTNSGAYRKLIEEKLSLTPEIIITPDKNMADFYLRPKLVQSKITPINETYSRYSVSLSMEVYAKTDILVDKQQQNRYIIIKNDENIQPIAKKMLLKLLEETLENFSIRLKNKELILG